MKKLLMIAAVAATLVSCAKDQVVNEPQEGIKFSVATENATKASEIYCSNYPLKDFLVYASYENQSDNTDKFRPYISGKKVSLDTDGDYSFSDGAYYWPETSEGGPSLDFFAIKNGTLAGLDDYNGAAVMTCSFTVNENVKEQTDLMYAVNMGAIESSGNVKLNFRHALSLIDFQAICTNKNLYVEISEVQICNIYGEGTYTLPIVTTTSQIIDTGHDKIDDNEPIEEGHPNYVNAQDASRGIWSFEGERTYRSVVFNPAISLTDSYQKLTSDIKGHTAQAKEQNSMLLIAQSNNAWQTDPTKEYYYEKYSDQNNKGTYFLVKCKVYNVAGETVAKDDQGNVTEVLHYDGYAAVPVEIDWKEGHQYMYSLIFDKKTDAGYDPEGDPILEAIELTVTVDDFIGWADSNDEHVGIETPASSTATAGKN